MLLKVCGSIFSHNVGTCVNQNTWIVLLGYNLTTYIKSLKTVSIL